MLFSIVIPTRDRLDLLADAVETIRHQDGPDWELVVFDNASQEPVRDYIQKLQDTRIRFAKPELIYSAIYQFMHPGVAPWAPEGYVSELKWAFFFGDSSEPFPPKTRSARSPARCICAATFFTIRRPFASAANYSPA